MIFGHAILLWSLVSLSIPIAIALWNRRRWRKEIFGAFYLLRRALQTTQRRIRLWELLKLLNRLVLLSCLIFIFAKPEQKVERLGSAKDGFAILLDVGRSLQGITETGQTLIQLQQEALAKTLDALPSEGYGIVAFVSNRCDTMLLDGGRETARPREWKTLLSPDRIPYTHFQTSVEGLQDCLRKADRIYGAAKIYRSFISALPQTINLKSLASIPLVYERLPDPVVSKYEEPSVVEERLEGQWIFRMTPPLARQAFRIVSGGMEPLGKVTGEVSVVATEKAWLLLVEEGMKDPFSGRSLRAIAPQKTSKVTVWAQKESPGYLSLLTALRNHPRLEVIRQIGGTPVGEAIILYGPYQGEFDTFERLWIFVDPDHPPFSVRDNKQWRATATTDQRRSFTLRTQDGFVFVKSYVLLDLDQYEPLEGFEDGAPALLKRKSSQHEFWVTPFNLEDLTTDLTLEATFIPYLYRRLDRWLESSSATASTRNLQPLWLLPGNSKPSAAVVADQRWPGIYTNAAASLIVAPGRMPEAFQNPPKTEAVQAGMMEELMSLRDPFYIVLACSLLLELLFCGLGARWLLIFFVGFMASPLELDAASTVRKVPMAYLQGMDRDRLTALKQINAETDRLSNLEFGDPQGLPVSEIWKAAVVVVSSSENFGPFSREDRERIREFCERGGILIFDDPLALRNSQFYKSVVSEMSQIFPGRNFQQVPKDDVLFRTYFLLQEVSGRRLASPYLEGLKLDDRWVAVFSSNDLLGANLRSSQGEFLLAVSPYGISQRVLAKRLWLNLMMYSLTLDYKDDAIHLPFILKRRVR